MKQYLSFSVIGRIIVCILLFWALDRHPYGYYTILRWVTCGIGVYSAYIAVSVNRIPWAWVFGFIALLFNPLIPVRLDRNTWAYIDVVIAILLLSSIFYVREGLSTKGSNNIQQ